MIPVKDKPKRKKQQKGKVITLKPRPKISFLKRPWQDLLVIFVLGLIAYSPVLNNDFVGFDDMALLVENPAIADDGLQAALSWGLNSPYYKPVVFLSWKLEKVLFGFNPIVFHLNNVLIHLFNCCLVYLLVLRFARFSDFTQQHRFQLAFFSGLLFALHPMHVESVAWAVERKDVLFSAFFLGGLWTYIRFTETKSWKWIALTALCYLGSIFCKAPGLMLIVVLFCYDYLSKRPVKMNLLVEKIPVVAVFFLSLYLYGLFNNLGAHTEGVTAGFDPAISNGDKFGNPGTGNLWTGFLMMNFKMLFWLMHSAFPFKLSIAYPRASFMESFGSFMILLPMVSLGLLGAIWKVTRSNRLAIFASLFFVATLLPALVRNDYGIGIFLSDRYSYLPSIAVIMAIVTFLIFIQKRLVSKIPNFSIFACGAIGILYFAGTFSMSQTWKNSETLWTNAIEKYPSISYPYANRSKFYLDHGQYSEALNDLNKAVQLDPNQDSYWVERARAHRQLKNYEQASQDLEKALALNPNNLAAHVNRGNVYHDLQQFDKALLEFNYVLEREPQHLNALTNRSSIHGQFGHTTLALKDINQVLQLQPNSTGALNNKIFVHFQAGQLQEVINTCNQYLLLKPDDHEIYSVRGNAYQKTGNLNKALSDLNQAIAMFANNGYYYEIRAGIYQQMNRRDLEQQDLIKVNELKGE